MKLSRKWLAEFVDISAGDKEFSDAMTLSGSKVEGAEDLGAEIQNVVVGRIEAMERHPDSDHMWVCQLDVGREAPVQIVTGAWNIHTGDLVPVALHKSILPGGKKIEKGKLRGVPSNGMLCSLKELGLDERDFPYAVIEAAALLHDYHPIDPDKPSIPADIQPGHKIFGPVVAAEVLECMPLADGSFHTCMAVKDATVCPDIHCSNVHVGDLVAYNTRTDSVCTLADLHAEQKEFPHCISDGIFVLREDCKPGDDIRPVVGLDDHVVEFEITPNRPDCLSVIGLAREAAATFNVPLRLHTPVVKGSDAPQGQTLNELLEVETPDPELCPRYTARMVRNVKIGPSPKWMRERLRAMGVRPINNIVDITNYVMLEYGQPMHAFDYRYVKGGKIVVRRAKEGEELTTLDGGVRTLTPNMLVIADETRAVGLAGVMGGLNSEIVADTSHVVFESANFDGTTIRRTAAALGMRTEASAKYEKGLDPLNTLPAVNRACELVELLGAGEVIDGVIDVLNYVPQPTVLKLEPEKINGLLGTDIPEDEMRAMLARLDFTLEGDTITVPSWRGDVEHYSDLAEEVARLHGYDQIPVTLMRGETTQGGLTEKQKAERRAGELCRSLGFSEIITYSFTSPSCWDKIRLEEGDSLRRCVTILNPLGEDTSVMRTTALPSMLEILARNYSARNAAVRLYELATTYHPVEGQDLADERQMLTLGAYGGDLDFFAFKGDVEALLAGMNVKNVQFERAAEGRTFHPGRCAEIRVNGTPVGILGQIHPLTAQNYGVDAALYAAQLEFQALLDARAPEARYVPLPRFPSMQRDIAVVCDQAVTVAALEDCIARGARGLLKETALFDIYTGAPIPEGKKSVAFSLTLRADDRTLTDAEADEDVKAVLALLERELGAVLR